MIELVSHDGGIPDGEFRREWEALVASDPDAGFFHTPRYLELWLHELGTRTLPRVHGVYRDGALVGVVPVGRLREGSPTGPIEVVRFLGGTDVTDYLGPVARPEDRKDVAAAYLARLAEDADWDEFVADGLPIPSGWPDVIAAAASDVGLEVLDPVDHEVCPRIDLAEGYDAYLSALGSKHRHELRRKARKLQRDAGELALEEVPHGDHERALDDFFAMAAEMGDDKARFFANDDMRAFFGALSDEFGPDRTLRIHELTVGGLWAASAVSLVHDREWGLYNSAFDGTLRMLAPGMVLVGELIRVAAEQDCRVFDLLRGDEAYKYRFGAEDLTLRRTTILRS